MTDLTPRLVALETRMAHYERMADDLSEVIADQAERIDDLTRRVKWLTNRLRETDAGWEPSPQDLKPPPHY